MSDFNNFIRTYKQVEKSINKSEEKKAIKWLEEKQKDYSLNSKDIHYSKIIYNMIKNGKLKGEDK